MKYWITENDVATTQRTSGASVLRLLFDITNLQFRTYIDDKLFEFQTIKRLTYIICLYF